jgi:hypothetical protein
MRTMSRRTTVYGARNSSRGAGRAGALALLALVAASLALPVLGASGTATATATAGLPVCAGLVPFGGSGTNAAGLPVYEQATVADYGQVLVFIGTLSWGGGYTPVQTGTQVYGSTLVLVLYDLKGYNVSVPLALNDSGVWSNSTVTVAAGSPTVDNLDLTPNTAWEPVTLTIGATSLSYSVATPISFLPNSIANVGGLDLLSMVVVSQMLIGLTLAFWVARWAMSRALWAPRFTLLIWGHVALSGLLAAVILDYQFVDSTFAGWSPLVYAFAISPMGWLWGLSLFNRTDPTLLERGDAPLGGRMTYHVWELAVGVDPRTGEKVLCRLTWSGFWARFWHHYTPLIPAQEGLVVDHFEAEVVKHRVVDLGEYRKQIRKGNPLDDYDVIHADFTGSRKDARKWTKLYWTTSEKPLWVEWPFLTIHREVEVPAKLSPEGNVLVPAHTKTKLALPHYDPGSAADLGLAPGAWATQQSVVLGWRTASSLAKVNSDLALRADVLESSFEARVADEVKTRLTAHYALSGRITHDLTEAEAGAEAANARSVDDYLRQLPTATKPTGGGP